MWLKRHDIGDLHEIDSDEITCTRETVKNEVLQIVQRAYESGAFEESINRFEYYCKCFDRGDELLCESN